MQSQVHNDCKQKVYLPGHEKIFVSSLPLFSQSPVIQTIVHPPFQGRFFKKKIDIVYILCLHVKMNQNMQMNKTLQNWIHLNSGYKSYPHLLSFDNSYI